MNRDYLGKKNWDVEDEVTNFICSLIQLTESKSILEIGTYKGKTSKAIVKVSPNISVITTDIKKYIDLPSSFLSKYENQFKFILRKNLDSFLKKKGGKFDVIFIDADHSFKALLVDMSFSLKHLNTSGIIILHDTLNPIFNRYIAAFNVIVFLSKVLLGKKFQHITHMTPIIKDRYLSGISVLSYHNISGIRFSLLLATIDFISRIYIKISR